MKKLLIAAFGVVFGTVSAYAACSSNEIDVNGDGTNCQTAHFSIGTTNIPANGTFTFNLSARGTFYVDCGDGGTLSGTGVSGKTITRSTASGTTLHACTYSTAGTKTIRFGGVATHYSTYYPAISFQDNSYVLSVDGNMSAMFPYLGSGTGQSPSFASAFYGCTNLTSISGTLFSNYTVGVGNMFAGTFQNCTSLQSISSDLFANMISAGGGGTFANTFSNCTGLTELPAGLFRNITNAGGGTFAYTFQDCTNLSGYIPGDMFAGLIANGSPGANDDVMYQTFKGDSGLAGTCPTGMLEVETPYSQYWDGKVACSNIELTSTTYVQNRISGLQNKFEGLGANKLMTFGSQAGQVLSRDIVTTLGTPNASGIYSNTSDTSVPTIGAINSAVIAKQDLLNGTTGFAITGTGTAGTLGEKAIYSLQIGPDSLIEAGTLNTAVVDAVNSEMTQINENGEPDQNGTLWRINDIVVLLDVTPPVDLLEWVNAPRSGDCSNTLDGQSTSTSACSVSGYGEWGVELGGAKAASNTLSVRGISACSSVSAETRCDIASNQSSVQSDYMSDIANAPTDSPKGANCFCKMTTPQTASAPWVFVDEYTTAKDCSGICANVCRGVFAKGPDANYFRSALFGLNSGANLTKWVDAKAKANCHISLDGQDKGNEECPGMNHYADWGLVLDGDKDTLTVTGISACSQNDGKDFTQAGIQSEYEANMSIAPTNSPKGSNCFCKLTNPQSGTAQWNYATGFKTAADCAIECASACAEYANNERGTIFGIKGK